MKITAMLIFILLFLLSCSNLPKKFATVDEGLQYISEIDHGFVLDTILPNEVKIRVQILPASLVQKSNEAGNQKYFSIQFSYKGNELLAQLPTQEYSSYVQLFSFGMEDQIKLITKEGKEYHANMVNYQPTYNMSKFNEVVAVFSEDVPKDQDVMLSIEEFGLKLGVVKFPIHKTILNYSPTIDNL